MVSPKENLFSLSTPFSWGPSAYWPVQASQISWIQGNSARKIVQQARVLAPRVPGVYGMVDEHGTLFYVGKAKDIRARLLHYFRPASRNRKETRILRHTRGLLWEACPSEFASLWRELELIRRWRPRFNVVGQPLRRRLAFLCLGKGPAPHAFLTRRMPSPQWASFGPLPDSEKSREAIRKLNDLFQLHDCSHPQEMIFSDQPDLFESEACTGCLRLEIGTCLGPCTGKANRDEYLGKVSAARRFLLGMEDDSLRALEHAMISAAQAQQFERAAVLRDRWAPLVWLRDRLARLRHAQREMSFVYPQLGFEGQRWWYLVHGARIVRVVLAPTNLETRRAAQKALQAIYFKKSLDSLLEPYEHADGMSLVMAWFRKHRKEHEKVISPADALKICG